MHEINSFGLKIHLASTAETIAEIEKSLVSRWPLIQHIVINAAKVVHAQKDEDLRRAINNSDIVNIDGQAVVWALRLLGHKVPHRVAGCDLFQDLVALCALKGYKPYFFGAKEEVLLTMIENLRKKHPALQIAGYRNGYYSDHQEEQIAQSIKESKADMLFLGITSPKKEIFIDKYSKKMSVPFTMGVGGSFDIVAGKTLRAPVWMQNAGLEWLYRIYQEPGRMWKRYLITNTRFILLIFRTYFSGKKQEPPRESEAKRRTA